MSEHRTFKYFKEETLKKHAVQYGWTLIGDSNCKDLFLDIVRQMDMSYSYKPVLIKAVLTCADDKGRVKLSDNVAYFSRFLRAATHCRAGRREGRQHLCQRRLYG